MNQTVVSLPASAPASGITAATVQEPASAAAAGAADVKLWSSFLMTLLALAFVLALAWLVLRLLKRVMIPRAVNGQAPVNVMQAVALGGRERLVIVRQGDHEYLLGVTAASVNLIDKRVIEAEQPSSVEEPG
jgi:flagellar biogenesis protein FliO